MAEAGFGRAAAAFLRRDLAVAASYRLSFALRVASLLMALVSVAFLARFVTGGEGGGGAPATGGAIARYGGAGYLGFWLIGFAVGEFFWSTMTALARRVRQAQLEGTLEAMLATPAREGVVVLAAAVPELTLAAARMALVLVAGALFTGVRFGPVHAGSLALVAGLALAAFLALCAVGGAMVMTLRRTDPVTALAGLVAAVAGGVFYPVSVLPGWLADAAYALPIAPALEGLRLAIFTGAAPGAIARELVALGGFVAVVGPLAAWLTSRALRRAREDGSLSQY